MDKEKLDSAGLKVWLELNSQLKEIGGGQLSSYLYVILILLDCTLKMFFDGDMKKIVNKYGEISNHLKSYVHYLKEKYEN